MKYRGLRVLIVPSIIIASASAYAATPTAAHLARETAESEDSSRPTPLPRPPADTEVAGIVNTFAAPATFQLVGFTQETFDGRRGVLNHTLACQREFGLSRICSAEEIRRTVIVPQSPGEGQAWIDSQPAPSIFIDDPRRLSRERELDETANCRGWKSSSPTDFGLAMDLGTMYGALTSQSCGQSLRVACCAVMGQ